jgi:uncharacterized repeat protein (TIGR03803 family)
MHKSLARSAIARTFVFLFALLAAAGAQTYSVLTSFDGTDGVGLHTTPLIDSLGNVFGTTVGGGSADCGVVFELVNNGGGSYTNTTIYDFTCGDDGARPEGGLVMDSAGNLYGIAAIFGAHGAGVAYELVNQGGGTYTFEVIHAFTGGKDGGDPTGDLVMFKGSLYGVTYDGGVNCGNGIGCGTVYRLTKSGGKWVETVLHGFNNHGDGYHPYAGVAIDSDGNLYGTTFGGLFANGTVFKLSPQGSGRYKETILHTFDHKDRKADGCDIMSGVVLDSAGDLYGTATECGKDGDGTVYQLKRSGSTYGFKVILTFNGKNGVNPYDETGHLAVDSAGNVYGTAAEGGAYHYGTVFKLAAGSFLYTALHEFNDNGTDGYYPYGGVSLDSLGNLYGTTADGGINGDYGTVWQIANP